MSAKTVIDMLRPKKLDIFIAKQFLLLFVATFFICQFVLMMQFLWRYVDELIGKGLSLEVLAQFFWYMGLMLVPQAFPLAILLSSLIAFGNLGESSELTAIKAAGVSLMQAFRPLILIVLLVAGASFYSQDVIGPMANQKFYQLLLSMKQKSPELEIPEGIFYDGIPNSNIYVQKKDLETGKLYGVMIYRMSGSYEDAAIILADSGMMQATAEKKHLLLTLWSGEWFENMRSQDLAGSASIPYRRETFWEKRIVLDFDGDFNLADGSGIASSARAKGLAKIYHDLDSIREFNDSVGRQYYREGQASAFRLPTLGQKDSLKAIKEARLDRVNLDSALSRLTPEKKLVVTKTAMERAQMEANNLDYKGEYANDLHRNERSHMIEATGKFTLALSCIIFFFIGAPLGAIIRKGGLGVPVIISVIVFIVYYIFDNSGMRMARDDNWTVWFGKWISTMVLAPLAVFFTYKATNDSVVFNIDAYKELLKRLLGLPEHYSYAIKEVVIDTPNLAEDARRLEEYADMASGYLKEQRLLRIPNPLKTLFGESDNGAQLLRDHLEETFKDLENSRDAVIINEMNRFFKTATRAHSRPFSSPWLNALLTVLVLPLAFFYFRIWRFRIKLHRELKRNIEAARNIMAYHAQRQQTDGSPLHI